MRKRGHFGHGTLLRLIPYAGPFVPIFGRAATAATADPKPGSGLGPAEGKRTLEASSHNLMCSKTREH